jgi:hypothetical protein
LNGIDHLEDLGVDEGIILKRVLKKKRRENVDRILSGSVQTPIEGSVKDVESLNCFEQPLTSQD